MQILHLHKVVKWNYAKGKKDLKRELSKELVFINNVNMLRKYVPWSEMFAKFGVTILLKVQVK